ncbi:MAG: S-methyl-5-thioribose-1-phosphate isomerase [Candidatus Hydrogenedentota bacterium]
MFFRGADMKLDIPKAIEWDGKEVVIIDQTLLPLRLKKIKIKRIEEMAIAIKTLQIRGAPAIGVASAFGVMLGMKNLKERDIRKRFYRSCEIIRKTRPTAVNLFWAIDKIKEWFEELVDKCSYNEIVSRITEMAVDILKDDEKRCLRMGMNGAKLLKDGDTVLTHCNAGAMATAGIGTALSVIYYAASKGKRIKVYVDETRPLLQGSRITAWELKRAGIDVTLITDNMAGWVMRKKGIDKVIVGADRIARNGDTANKIGTYSIAILAKEHHIPFYVVAPLSTIDISLNSGEYIPIEERGWDEIIMRFGVLTAPRRVKAFNPAFDVTPSKYISAIITDMGIVYRPYTKSIMNLMSQEKGFRK